MPRFREWYTLYQRKMKDGRKVWYYRTYDQHGRRTSGRSTGETNKARARDYCNQLLREGQLVPTKTVTFANFARDFWVYDKCAYVRWKNATGTRKLSRKHVDTQRGYLNNWIWPHFRHYRLDQITQQMCDEWVVKLQESDLKQSSVAHAVRVFRTMLNWAVRKGYIRENPLDHVRVSDARNPRGMLTYEEAKELFSDPGHFPDTVTYVLNRFAAGTGARAGECQRMTWEDVGEDRVIFPETKSGEPRIVPISPEIRKALEELPHREGYVFSLDGGKTQYKTEWFTEKLYAGLAAIGISDSERRRRNIVFHSWRVFAETRMRDAGIPDPKIRAILGHRSERMSDIYTEFRQLDLSDARGVQDRI